MKSMSEQQKQKAMIEIEQEFQLLDQRYQALMARVRDFEVQCAVAEKMEQTIILQ